MAEKNDYIPVSASNTLRVAARNDSNQNQHDTPKKKQEEKHTNIEVPEKATEELEPTELIEFGRLLLQKRNAELKLFSLQKNTEDISENTSTEIIGLQVKIASLEKDIQELHLTNTTRSTSDNIDEQIKSLEKLHQLNIALLDCVKEERTILNIDDIDFLETIIRQKDDILNQCDMVRNEINFRLFDDLLDTDPKKIKYRQMVTDLRSLINEIIEYEDENAIELHNVREKMKLILTKQDIGAKTISQYTQSTNKSHFIDKKQ
ncbi:MAG: hypothetical protein FWG20_01810 [Candidatus Cloacimonetes bacterium]|nr:hypothetical protein [Candidatus Cloacimonadota bacterium]